MILSVHIPKTAGSSFRQFLQSAYGSRLMWDYGDWPERFVPEGQHHNALRRAEMLTRLDEIGSNFDVIHGHYRPEKYADLFGDTRVVTFVRDPYQHAISTYRHAQRQVASLDDPGTNPGLRRFRDQRMTIVEMIEISPNHQASFLSGVAFDDVAMYGISEQFDRAVALFQAVFGIRGQSTSWQDNVNPDQNGKPYDVPDEVRRAVEKHRPEDIVLYRRARERFATLTRRYGV